MLSPGIAVSAIDRRRFCAIVYSAPPPAGSLARGMPEFPHHELPHSGYPKNPVFGAVTVPQIRAPRCIAMYFPALPFCSNSRMILRA
jgi:hypothetical protein